jgi:hypothetical protein
MISVDLIWTGIAFLCTILVFSYLIGDNALFRLVVSLFVGVAAGYAAAVAWKSVLWPMLFRPILFPSALDERLLAGVPLLLGLLMLFKLSPRLSRLGNPPLAYLVGVGAAVALGGVVVGTLFPQARASMNVFHVDRVRSEVGLLQVLLSGGVILAGTLSTLIYFRFGVRVRPYQELQQHGVIRWIGQLGGVFIAMAFGSIYAGVFLAALVALIERLQFLWHVIYTYIY